MNALDVIRRLHQHRIHANRQLRAGAATLNEDQLRQSFLIGQGSIWRSLTHMYAAEFVWLEACQGNERALTPGDLPGELPGSQRGTGGFAGFKELDTAWTQLDERWTNYLAELTEASLDELVYRVSTSSGHGKRWGTPRSDILLHVCTHAHYTGAQAVNMLRTCGVSPLPDLMLISLSRAENRAHMSDVP